MTPAASGQITEQSHGPLLELSFIFAADVRASAAAAAH